MSSSRETESNPASDPAAPDREPAAVVPKTNLVALQRERERAVELISLRFSDDVIDADEMERRLEIVATATDLAQLAEVTDDLESPGNGAGAAAGAMTAGAITALVPAGAAGIAPTVRDDAVPEHSRSIAILGDSKRDGAWVPARRIRAFNLLGDTTFDFREARFGPGRIDIRVRSILGDVVLIVPPGLAVEVDCPAVLASVKRELSASAQAVGQLDDHTPRVRVHGFVALSELRIEERLPGESRREARKRRKRERKQLAGNRDPRRLGDGS